MSIVRKSCFAGAAALALLAFGAGASADTLTPVAAYSGPNAIDTSILGINNAGWTTGSVDFADGSTDGFIRDPSGTYTLFSDQIFTQGRAISNSNVAVGFSTPLSSAGGARSTWQEFTYAIGGSPTHLTNPGTALPLHGIAQGIDDSGAIVGSYVASPTGNTPNHGFILNGASFTDLEVNGSSNTDARGIANNGTVVGWYVDPTTHVTTGFVRAPDGTITTVADPGGVASGGGSVLEAINNYNVAMGTWTDAAGNQHGFQYNIATHAITEINIPNATTVTTWGVNDSGQFVVTSDVGNYIYTPGGPSAPGGAAVFMPVAGAGLPAGTNQFAIGVQAGLTYYIDPAYASGFEYLAGTGPDFASVTAPSGVGTGVFQLWLQNGSGQWVFDTDITGGTPFVFGSPVGAFEIRGIPQSAMVDPSNPNGWVTGLTFAGSGQFNGYEIALGVPEPATWAMLLLGVGLIGAAARQSRRQRGPAPACA